MEETLRLRSLVEEINRSKVKTDYELVNLRINLEEAKNENSTVLQELENTRNKLADAEQLISSQDKLVRDLEEKIQENSFRGAEPAAERSEADGAEAPEEQQLTPSSAISDNKQISDPLRDEELGRLSQECKSLQELVQKLEEKNANLQADCLRKDGFLLSSNNKIEQLEARASEVSLAGPGSCVTPLVSEAASALSVPDTSLQETAEVRERLESVQAEKDKLEGDVSRLEEELSIIAVASRTLTACTVIPVIVLLIAIVMAFQPLISSIFGTRDF